MATTPNLKLPYPGYDDPADVPSDTEKLALALDALYAQVLFQPGDIKVSAANNPTQGWLACDGAAVSRSTYANLFAAVGVAYGTGDGSTTFNLPDYRGRTIVGAGAGTGLTSRALGSTGGEEAHTLSATEMPSHNHTGVTGTDSPDHTHQYTAPLLNTVFAAGANAGAWNVGTTAQTGGAKTRHTHTIPAQGGGGGHNNMSPYATANVFIKT